MSSADDKSAAFDSPLERIVERSRYAEKPRRSCLTLLPLRNRGGSMVAWTLVAKAACRAGFEKMGSALSQAIRPKFGDNRSSRRKPGRRCLQRASASALICRAISPSKLHLAFPAKDIFYRARPLRSGTGLVQQTDQIVAAHDLSLFVMHVVSLVSTVNEAVSK